VEAQTYCWICKKVADSAEHRIKKSDLVNLYGSGSYKGKNAVVLIREGQKISVQGPNSKLVKYKKNLCSKCNNEFSQPFDKAYESFITYIRQNKDLILKRRFIDFQDIYGDEFAASQCNLYKYFVKSLGCRLANDGYPIPEDLPALLPKRPFRTRLRITFAVHEDFLLLPEAIKTAGKGDLMTFLPVQETRPTWLEKWRAKKYGRTRPLEYQWNESFEWLYVWYWYNTTPSGKLGSTWIADSQYIYLGSYEVLSDEERQKLLEQYSSLIDNTTEIPAV
jgi:hypothetical protein